MRKTRRETGLFVVEGAAVIIAARDAGFVPETLVYLADHAAGDIVAGVIAWAGRQGADLVLFTELFLSGYPPEDLVLKPAFIEKCRAAAEDLAKDTANGAPGIAIGVRWRHPMSWQYNQEWFATPPA